MSGDNLADRSSFDDAILRIERRIRTVKDVPEDFRIVPEPWTREIYQAIESGILLRDEMQSHLGIPYSELVSLLEVMLKLGIVSKRFNKENYNAVEFYIPPIDEDGTSGQPAIVPV